MKYLKRVIAYFISMIMVITNLGVLPAFAETDGTTTQTPAEKSIKINGLEEGDNVKYYKVVQWAADGSGWEFVDPFASSLSPAQKDEILGHVKTNEDGTKEVVKGKITDKTAQIMGAAGATALNGNGDTVSGTSWSATGLVPGLYMALITDAAANAEDGTSTTTMHVYNPVFLAVQADSKGSEVTLPLNYDDNGTAKKSDVTVDKKAKSANGDWVEATTEDVGDIIDFKVEVTVPAYLESWTNPVFTVTDTMTTGLTLAVKEGTGDAALTDITVTGVTTGVMTADTGATDEATGETTADTQYTITKSATGYTITFKDAYLKGRTAAELVTITYKAKITTEAKNVNPETNTVKIEYSKNPNTATDHGTKEDKTTHYTFSIDAGLFGDEEYETSELIKVGVDAAGNPVTEEKTYPNGTKHNPLQGAEFALYTDSACTKPYTNSYSNITADTRFTSDENGRLTITGLDEGTYYLKETKAATGYQLLNDKVEYTITASYRDVPATDACNAYKELSGYTVTVNGGNTSTYVFEGGTIKKTNNAAGDLSTEITNTQGTSLPSTGGIGTTIFYIVGGIMVAGAVVFLLTKRRVAGNE
jgi:fimbrial isopeptide formation D2 family protein/LPXTG-motif cell wall-anchored protein